MATDGGPLDASHVLARQQIASILCKLLGSYDVEQRVPDLAPPLSESTVAEGAPPPMRTASENPPASSTAALSSSTFHLYESGSSDNEGNDESVVRAPGYFQRQLQKEDERQPERVDAHALPPSLPAYALGPQQASTTSNPEQELQDVYSLLRTTGAGGADDGVAPHFHPKQPRAPAPLVQNNLLSNEEIIDHDDNDDVNLQDSIGRKIHEARERLEAEREKLQATQRLQEYHDRMRALDEGKPVMPLDRTSETGLSGTGVSMSGVGAVEEPGSSLRARRIADTIAQLNQERALLATLQTKITLPLTHEHAGSFGDLSDLDLATLSAQPAPTASLAQQTRAIGDPRVSMSSARPWLDSVNSFVVGFARRDPIARHAVDSTTSDGPPAPAYPVSSSLTRTAAAATAAASSTVFAGPTTHAPRPFAHATATSYLFSAHAPMPAAPVAASIASRVNEPYTAAHAYHVPPAARSSHADPLASIAGPALATKARPLMSNDSVFATPHASTSFTPQVLRSVAAFSVPLEKHEEQPSLSQAPQPEMPLRTHTQNLSQSLLASLPDPMLAGPAAAHSHAPSSRASHAAHPSQAAAPRSSSRSSSRHASPVPPAGPAGNVVVSATAAPATAATSGRSTPRSTTSRASAASARAHAGAAVPSVPAVRPAALPTDAKASAALTAQPPKRTGAAEELRQKRLTFFAGRAPAAADGHRVTSQPFDAVVDPRTAIEGQVVPHLARDGANAQSSEENSAHGAPAESGQDSHRSSSSSIKNGPRTSNTLRHTRRDPATAPTPIITTKDDISHSPAMVPAHANEQGHVTHTPPNGCRTESALQATLHPQPSEREETMHAGRQEHLFANTNTTTTTTTTAAAATTNNHDALHAYDSSPLDRSIGSDTSLPLSAQGVDMSTARPAAWDEPSFDPDATPKHESEFNSTLQATQWADVPRGLGSETPHDNEMMVNDSPRSLGQASSGSGRNAARVTQRVLAEGFDSQYDPHAVLAGPAIASTPLAATARAPAQAHPSMHAGAPQLQQSSHHSGHSPVSSRNGAPPLHWQASGALRAATATQYPVFDPRHPDRPSFHKETAHPTSSRPPPTSDSAKAPSATNLTATLASDVRSVLGSHGSARLAGALTRLHAEKTRATGTKPPSSSRGPSPTSSGNARPASASRADSPSTSQSARPPSRSSAVRPSSARIAGSRPGSARSQAKADGEGGLDLSIVGAKVS
jgi:hypothetical protein